MKFLLLMAFVLPLMATDDEWAHRIQAHLIIEDLASAKEESLNALSTYPRSKKIHESYIQVLAKNGDEKGMLSAWKEYTTLFPEEKDNREVLETLAWGVIDQGSRSTSPIIRVITLLAAFYANDAKGVQHVAANLHDPSVLIRGAAVELASQMRDEQLRREMAKVAIHETDWKVRLNAILGVGAMEIEEMRPHLQSILTNDRSMAEEKMAATIALVQMSDEVDRASVEQLVYSDRSGLRMLASKLVAHLDSERDQDLMLHLLKDSNPEVRKAALQTVGLMRIPAMPETDDLDPETAIHAAWVLTLNAKEKGQQAFRKWIEHHDPKVRQIAAGALVATGRYGFPYTLEAFKTTQDPYVRMNLAHALISQRIEPELGSEALYEGITTIREKWMWKENDIIKVIAPSEVGFREVVPNYPEAVNQMVRLEVLNTLATMKHPQAQKAIQAFLEEKSWGITGMASALLLTEGDEAALDLVKNLLNHPMQKVRVQAALILSLWGGDEQAIQMLKEAYPSSTREMKEQILEGLGKIGSPKTFDFLVDKLHEPYQTLRLIAACSLLHCLYH